MLSQGMIEKLVLGAISTCAELFTHYHYCQIRLSALFEV
jgi:hypothetical protein